MKTIFIEAQKKSFEDISISDEELKKLPGKIFIAYSVQYKKLAEILSKKLNKIGKEITGFKQILGCSKLKSKSPILLVGSGRFHALNLLLQGNNVFLLQGNKIKKLNNKSDNKEILRIKQKTKAALVKFLSADKIGILVSCKSGQENLTKALALKKNLEKKGKTAFLFIADNINFKELENFPEIQSWINTACPTLIFDDFTNKILNIQELNAL